MNPMQKLRLVVARGVLNLVKHAGLQVMQVNLLEGETRDEVERVQNYGFSGNPPSGSTLVAVAVGGSRDHMIVVACEHPSHSPELQSGESAMYTQFGQLFKMDKNGNVTLTCPGNFTVDAKGNISQTAAGSVGITSSSSSVSVTAADSLNMATEGALGIQATGGSAIQGGLDADRVRADKVESHDVILHTHTHGGVVAGGADTKEPNK